MDFDDLDAQASAAAEQIRAGLDGWVQEAMAFDATSILHPPAHPRNIFARMGLFAARERICRAYGFCMPGPAFVSQVGRAGPLVDIGAGRGFLAALLRRHGVDAIATDPCTGPSPYGWNTHPDWAVEAMDATTAVQVFPDRAVLCSWPSLDESWAGEAIAHMRPGQTLFLIGEGQGGCTGDDLLFGHLDTLFAEITAPQDRDAVASWPGINDRLTVWRRL